MSKCTASVLITGAAGGVGRALVEQFTQQGWRVFATDLDAANLTALQAQHPLAGAMCADIRRPSACQEVVSAAIAAMGRLDVLINAAGIWREGPVEECCEEDFDLVLDVNLKGTFFMCAAAIAHLKLSEGSILNISSDAGRQGNKNAAAYCASKGGVTLLSKTLALDLAPFGVRCNAISPGDIDTPMLRFQAEQYGQDDPSGYYQELLSKYPQGARARFIQAREIAELAFFVCQPGARSITGADLAIDCGLSAGN
ncbi:SDR family oxidoreductase [Pseudomonas sp. SIMBA_077]